MCTWNLFYLSIEDRMYLVDIEVIKARTHEPSETRRGLTRTFAMNYWSVIFVVCG